MPRGMAVAAAALCWHVGTGGQGSRHLPCVRSARDAVPGSFRASVATVNLGWDSLGLGSVERLYGGAAAVGAGRSQGGRGSEVGE